MKIRYLLYLAIVSLAVMAAGCDDLGLAITLTLIMTVIFIVTEVLSRLADIYE